jgi:hypothetical protein
MKLGLIKRLVKWAGRTLKREGKKELLKRIDEKPFEELGLPRSKHRKRGQ